MNAYLTIENNFSVLISVDTKISKGYLVSILTENKKFIKTKNPNFEFRLKKSFKNNCTKFASGQLVLDYNQNGFDKIVNLTSFVNPKWWLSKNPKFLQNNEYYFNF